MPARTYIFENLRWKLGALLFAIITWLAVQFAIWNVDSDGKTRVLPKEPVRIVTAPEDAAHYRVDPPVVDVVVRMTAVGEKNLNRRKIQVYADVAEAPQGVGFVRELRVHCPDGVQFIKTEPRAVFIERLPNPHPLPKENPTSP